MEWMVIILAGVLVLVAALAYQRIGFQKREIDEFASQLLETQKELSQSIEVEQSLQKQLVQLQEKKIQFDQLQLEIVELRKIESDYKSQLAQVSLFKERVQKLEQELDKSQQKAQETQSKLAQLETKSAADSASAEERIKLLQEAKTQLSAEFKTLANEIFDTKQQQFHQNSKQSIDAMLQPVKTSIEQFKTRLETTHKEDVEGRAGLKEQLASLQKLNQQMSAEAHNLTQALKGDSKTQGNWGELVLERILERSGLREGEEFEREKSFTTQEGKRLRPDVIINLPDNKHVIVDSKVSLIHYEKVLSNENENEKHREIRAHVNSLKNHIKALAEKRYDHLKLLNAPDFVLMFVPIEGAYLMAIEADNQIFEDAFAKRVAVVTPTTLFTTLKTIEQLWRYERQSENTVKLIQKAADVHDKFVGFVESFEKVGKQLETATNTFQQARTRMTSGSGNLVRQAQMLKDLAGKTKKEIPEHLLQEADVELITDKSE